ncbi:hypothetical protein [Dyadobacter fermentans]|uniref:Lipocalin-like domain-containing protein n=1 Tax=Dyadobacter fermentans (strain ATCC 700827 / DSM 18053 / CIP 107007 / KCTC 52180 / NS114) TaxID=471854 RepID=C6VUJ2_DYAFD|nr:hypothetical protein [Dyadobacter fermentans]ACT91301.1 hypothetical protein Dfer_0029 [Dyadobacter fermentans DSM 18053]
MKRLLLFVPVLILSLLVLSCKDKDKEETPGPTEKSKILVNYPWRMSTVTDLSGKDISENQLSVDTRYIKQMDIQFQQNARVNALDQKSSQVINGGTWYLINEDKTLDIKIIGFAGEFGLEELTNSKMRLKSKMPVNGVEQEAIMVFQPVIK